MPHPPPPVIPSPESPVQTVYPSIASLKAGRALGVLYESIPLPLGTVKLSHLLFPLPTAPIAAVLYLGLKLWGRRYRLSTHRLRAIRGIGQRLETEIPIDEIARMEVIDSFGQRFFNAGDLVIRDHQGTERMRIEGIPRPEMFRQTILDIRESLIATDSAQRTIAARSEGRRVTSEG